MKTLVRQPTTTYMLAALGLIVSQIACAIPTPAPLSTPTPTVPPPTPTYEPGVFAGYYVNSFEVSSFVPCGLAEKPGDGQGYWFAGTAEFFKLYEQIPASESDSPGRKIVFVHFKGELSAEGEYGHLGGYSREIAVIELIEVAPVAEGQCDGF